MIHQDKAIVMHHLFQGGSMSLEDMLMDLQFHQYINNQQYNQHNLKAELILYQLQTFL
jgi:hypothetical protein